MFKAAVISQPRRWYGRGGGGGERIIIHKITATVGFTVLDTLDLMPNPPTLWNAKLGEPGRPKMITTEEWKAQTGIHVSMLDIHLGIILRMYCPAHTGVTGNDRARKSSYRKWLASWKVWTAEELETVPADWERRTSHHWSPGGERRRKGKRFPERTRKRHRQSDE